MPPNKPYLINFIFHNLISLIVHIYISEYSGRVMQYTEIKNDRTNFVWIKM